jgi:hypothetical protein
MLQSELSELRAEIAKVNRQDFHLGRVLTMLADHLASAHGLEDEQPEAESDEKPAQATKKGKYHAN